MSEERKNAYRAAYVSRFEAKVRLLENDCESELERLFLLALLQWTEHSAIPTPSDLVGAVGFDRVCLPGSRPSMWCEDQGPKLDWEEPCRPVPMKRHVRTEDFCFTWVVPQYELSIAKKQYRIDFAFLPVASSACPPFAVELDGHDFHERTKEQAARDRSRDRAMQNDGWQVIRFTGSELWKDPVACVQAVRTAMFWEEVRRDLGSAAQLKFQTELYGVPQ